MSNEPTTYESRPAWDTRDELAFLENLDAKPVAWIGRRIRVSGLILQAYAGNFTKRVCWGAIDRERVWSWLVAHRYAEGSPPCSS